METLTAQRCRDPLPGPGRRPRDWLDSATVYGVTVLFVITAAWVGDPGNRSTRGRLDHSMKRQAADTPNRHVTVSYLEWPWTYPAPDYRSDKGHAAPPRRNCNPRNRPGSGRTMTGR
jgi:hypothetical protein